jgi:glycosyltransferase involved in cell wall biosynthesis
MDRNILKAGSDAHKRMQEYSALVDELHIIVFSQEKQKEQHTGNLTIYPTNSRTRWLYISDAVCIARAIADPDVVTAQDPFETGLAGWLITRKNNAALQLQIHTDFLSPSFRKESALNRMRVVLARFLIPRASCLRVVSGRIKNALVREFGVTPSAIAVLPIFTDTEHFRNAPVTTDLHKKYPQFDFIVLMASRLTREKNIPLALDALCEVVKKHPKTGLVVVGNGPEEKKLKTESHKLKTNIVFEPWADDLASHYKTADLFLLTSDYEGYARSVVEASAAGLPVVMTDVGTAGELIQDGRNGLVVPTGDAPALIHAIERIREGKVRLQASLPAQTRQEYAIAQRTLWESCCVAQGSFKKH